MTEPVDPADVGGIAEGEEQPGRRRGRGLVALLALLILLLCVLATLADVYVTRTPELLRAPSRPA